MDYLCLSPRPDEFLKTQKRLPFLGHYTNKINVMRKGMYNIYLHYLSAETKNQWARDDPAFIVICILLLAVSAVAYSAA